MHSDYSAVDAALLVVADLRKPEGRRHFRECFEPDEHDAMIEALRGQPFAYYLSFEVEGRTLEQSGTFDGCDDGDTFVSLVLGSALPTFLEKTGITSATTLRGFRVIASKVLTKSLRRVAGEIKTALERPGSMH